MSLKVLKCLVSVGVLATSHCLAMDEESQNQGIWSWSSKVDADNYELNKINKGDKFRGNIINTKKWPDENKKTIYRVVNVDYFEVDKIKWEWTRPENEDMEKLKRNFQKCIKKMSNGSDDTRVGLDIYEKIFIFAPYDYKFYRQKITLNCIDEYFSSDIKIYSKHITLESELESEEKNKTN